MGRTILQKNYKKCHKFTTLNWKEIFQCYIVSLRACFSQWLRRSLLPGSVVAADPRRPAAPSCFYEAAQSTPCPVHGERGALAPTSKRPALTARPRASPPRESPALLLADLQTFRGRCEPTSSEWPRGSVQSPRRADRTSRLFPTQRFAAT